MKLPTDYPSRYTDEVMASIVASVGRPVRNPQHLGDMLDHYAFLYRWGVKTDGRVKPETTHHFIKQCAHAFVEGFGLKPTPTREGPFVRFVLAAADVASVRTTADAIRDVLRQKKPSKRK